MASPRRLLRSRGAPPGGPNAPEPAEWPAPATQNDATSGDFRGRKP